VAPPTELVPFQGYVGIVREAIGAANVAAAAAMVPSDGRREIDHPSQSRRGITTAPARCRDRIGCAEIDVLVLRLDRPGRAELEPYPANLSPCRPFISIYTGARGRMSGVRRMVAATRWRASRNLTSDIGRTAASVVGIQLRRDRALRANPGRRAEEQ
jgi:hypothetical protein